ncbi:MAG: Ig-like domain-containing protein [Planctomycetota bacterium]
MNDGRPVVTDSFPTGNGLTISTPIVVLFNESLSADSLASGEPTTGPGGIPVPGTPGVFVRDTASSTPVTGTIDLLFGGRAVLFLPAALVPMTEYEIVVASTVTDTDGVPLDTEEFVAGFFTTDAADDSEPQVVGTLPMDNDGDVPVGADVFVFFDRAADAMTVNAANLVLTTGGVPEPAVVTTPIMGLAGPDTRIAQLSPTAPLLAPGTRYELELSTAIQFGDEPLDTGGASPFSIFDTVGLSSAVDFRVVGAPTAFPLAITGPLLADVNIDVDVDASVPSGSVVVVRIYGGDASTAATDDLTFLEATAVTMADGPTTVTVPFGTTLGLPGATVLDEGSVTVQATIRLGDLDSGFIGVEGNGSLDTGAPEILSFAPMLADDTTTIVTDQASVLAFGTASEQIASAEFVVGSTTVGLFASNAAGEFILEPILLDRSTSTASYILNLTDMAGNVATMALTGDILSRGVVRGPRTGGDMVVEVYDEATLAVVPNATVVVETSTGAVTAMTDDMGIASFVGVAAGSTSVTAAANGFDLASLLDTEASFVSLPVRPIGVAASTATLNGTAVFIPDGSTTARLGTNLPADPMSPVASSTAGSPNMPGNVLVRTGRPFANSALSGNFAAPASPFFSDFACELCGIDGLTPSVGTAPAAAGDTVDVFLPTGTPPDTMPLVITTPPTVDFGAAGLGTLAGGPQVDVFATYNGLPGSMMVGAGFATAGTGMQFTINGAYFTSSFGVLASLGPTLMLSTSAQDTDGVMSRVRQIVVLPASGTLLPSIVPIGGAVLTPSAMAGAASVTATDVLDPNPALGQLGMLEVTATDAAGRSWRIFRQDTDASGGTDDLDLPDLNGLGVTGLQAGDWAVQADAMVFVDLAGSASNFLFEDRLRLEIARSRGLAITITVN